PTASPAATATATLPPTATSTASPTLAPPTATASATATATFGTSGCPATGPLPLGPRMYVGLKGTNCIAIYDPSTNTELGRIPVNGGPDALALSPNGARLYATNTGGNTVTVINT